MLCWMVVTDISKERSAFIFRMKQFKKGLPDPLKHLSLFTSQQSITFQKTWIVGAFNCFKGVSICYQIWNATVCKLWINENMDLKLKTFFTLLSWFPCSGRMRTACLYMAEYRMIFCKQIRFIPTYCALYTIYKHIYVLKLSRRQNSNYSNMFRLTCSHLQGVHTKVMFS
jgi:hypothetical protein